MVGVLAWLSGALAAAGFASVIVLVVRRLRLARGERLRGTIEERLRPLALALTHGETDARADSLSTRDALVLAGILARSALLTPGTGVV